MLRGAAFVSARRQSALGSLAIAQHGAVASSQLVALGFTRHHIRRLCETGWLHRVHHGVYAVGRRSLSTKGHWMAAVLACRSGAVLSHRSAGALHGLLRNPPRMIEVSAPIKRRIPGIRTHLCQSLEPADRTVVHGIPCTSVARTLLDIATVADRRQLERALDEAEVQRLVTRQGLAELLDRSKGRRGAAQLRAVLAEHDIGTTLTRSDLEELTLAVIRDAGLPRPLVNAAVQGASGRMYEVDFHWPDRAVVLEVDGRKFHATASAIERDRRKEADLTAAGRHVLRSTWRQAVREPEQIARMLRVALA